MLYRATYGLSGEMPIQASFQYMDNSMPNNRTSGALVRICVSSIHIVNVHNGLYNVLSAIGFVPDLTNTTRITPYLVFCLKWIIIITLTRCISALINTNSLCSVFVWLETDRCSPYLPSLSNWYRPNHIIAYVPVKTIGIIWGMET